MEIDHKLYHSIVEAVPEAVIFADRDGLIRIWNGGAEIVFGFTRAEVEGGSLDIIIPAALRERHWLAYRQAIASGALAKGSRVLPTRALHKTKGAIYCDLSFAVITDEAGIVLGAVAVGRDVTERYLAEKARRKRLDEPAA